MYHGLLGDEFDPDKLDAYPRGSVIVLPDNTSHFHWAKSGEYVTQVAPIGPLGLDYISAQDDPRNKQITDCLGDFRDSAQVEIWSPR